MTGWNRRSRAVSFSMCLRYSFRVVAPPQIASRLDGEYHVLHFFGDDIRLLRKNRL